MPDSHPGNPQDATERTRIAGTVGWLAAHQPGVLPWGDDHLKLAPAARRASWVDVIIPAMCADLAVNWAWTIISTDDEDAHDAWPNRRDSMLIAVEPDCTLHAVVDPSTGWFLQDGPVATTEILSALTVSERDKLEQAASRIGGTVAASPGWTDETLCRALESWTSAVAGRRDLVFAFDPDITSGRAESIPPHASVEAYDLGDGLTGTSALLDQLLEFGPDEAAQATRALKGMPSLSHAPRPAPDSRWF